MKRKKTVFEVKLDLPVLIFEDTRRLLKHAPGFNFRKEYQEFFTKFDESNLSLLCSDTCR